MYSEVRPHNWLLDALKLDRLNGAGSDCDNDDCDFTFFVVGFDDNIETAFSRTWNLNLSPSDWLQIDIRRIWAMSESHFLGSSWNSDDSTTTDKDNSLGFNQKETIFLNCAGSYKVRFYLFVYNNIKGLLGPNYSRVSVLGINLVLSSLLTPDSVNIHLLLENSEVSIEDELKVGGLIGIRRNKLPIIVVLNL